jgi:hypothetical protein
MADGGDAGRVEEYLSGRELIIAGDKHLLRGGEQTGTNAEQGREKHIISIIIEAEGQSASHSSRHLGGGVV